MRCGLVSDTSSRNSRVFHEVTILQCQGGTTTGPQTKVYTLAPGATISFNIDYDKAYHPGPFTVYLAKAPGGDVTTYDGSGAEWVSESAKRSLVTMLTLKVSSSRSGKPYQPSTLSHGHSPTRMLSDRSPFLLTHLRGNT